jgi:hypothetical protein
VTAEPARRRGRLPCRRAGGRSGPTSGDLTIAFANLRLSGWGAIGATARFWSCPDSAASFGGTVSTDRRSHYSRAIVPAPGTRRSLRRHLDRAQWHRPWAELQHRHGGIVVRTRCRGPAPPGCTLVSATRTLSRTIEVSRRSRPVWDRLAAKRSRPAGAWLPRVSRL